MMSLLSKIPPYAYLCGIIGATATYLFYTPPFLKNRRRKAELNGKLKN